MTRSTFCWWLLFCQQCYINLYPSVFTNDLLGEGCVSIMGDVRVSSGTKQHDLKPRRELAPSQTIVKRSYKRAIKRVETHGYTWYRGSILTPDDIPHRNTTKIKVSQPTLPVVNNIKRREFKGQRYSCLSWNAGGLRREQWDVFNAWLQLQDINVIMLQESHWRHTSEWIQANYFCMHSGGTSHAGILTMISKQFCQPDNISWNDWLPGRILQTRLHFTNRSLDLFNCYQFVNEYNRLPDRADFWQHLQTAISTIPNRNLLLVAGDFNTSLTCTSTAVGLSTYLYGDKRQRGSKARDEDRFRLLLAQFDLVALNTWNQALGPTYSSSQHTSRIDFLLTRGIHADSQAKQVKYLEQMPLIALSETRHFPMLTSLPRQWFYQKAPSVNGWTLKQRRQLRQHWQDESTVWQAMQAHVAEHFTTVITDPNCLTMEDYHGHLSTSLQTELHNAVLPKEGGAISLNGLEHLMTCLKKIKSLNNPSLCNLFLSWKLLTQCGKARQVMKLHSKMRRKQKRQDLMHHAREAANANDQYQLFWHIRALCPKTPRKLVRLRDQQGQILGPEGAAQSIADWLHELYSDPFHSSPTATQVQTWPFSIEEITESFQSFEPVKALDHPYASALFWKQNAVDCSIALQSMAMHWCSQEMGSLPVQWSQGTVVFIPKPHKKCKDPSDLRPICLLEPTGKAILGIFAQRVMQAAVPFLIQLPQYAYMKNRSCSDAITRVLDHIDLVQQQLSDVQYPVHRIASLEPPVALRGGLMLSLDLSKAFDTVHRTKLFQALTDFSVPSELCDILKSIYSRTTLKFSHRGVYKEVVTKRGIRQGCRAAPYLWLVYIGHLQFQLASLTDWSWLQQCNSTFADDWIIHQYFESLQMFRRLIKYIGILFDLLATYGLEINDTKTVVLFKAAGSSLPKLTRRYIHRCDSGTYLRVPRKGGKDTFLKLVQKHVYLGIQLSYNAYQKHTVDHRLHCARNAAALLAKWLRGRGGLTKFQRTKLWQQTILTSLHHALSHVGFTAAHLQLLDAWSLTQLRHIYQEPVHLNHISHQDFLHSHNLTDPLILLRRRVVKTIAREEFRVSRLDPLDILLQHNRQRPFTVLQVLDNLLTTRRLKEYTPQIAHFECIFCNTYFATAGMLRKHVTIHHGQREGQIRFYNPYHDPVGGGTHMPKMQSSFHSVGSICETCWDELHSWIPAGARHYGRPLWVQGDSTSICPICGESLGEFGTTDISTNQILSPMLAVQSVPQLHEAHETSLELTPSPGIQGSWGELPTVHWIWSDTHCWQSLLLLWQNHQRQSRLLITSEPCHACHSQWLGSWQSGHNWDTTETDQVSTLSEAVHHTRWLADAHQQATPGCPAACFQDWERLHH